jgi:hypothetical protein
MKVRHLDVFQDRRHGLVCETQDITDAVNPRSAHSCEPLDNTCYFGITGRVRNYLLGHVVKRYRELPDVSRDVSEDVIDGRRGQIHRVAFPYEMGGAFEVKFTLLEQIDKTIPDVIAGCKSYVGVDTIFLKYRLLERQDVLVIDFEVSDTRRCLSYGASIQSSPMTTC